ncbi:ABC transporter permease [Paenibacillus sp. GCM10027626]|uniref:ABC transporter permease n=1 Tax=Paenibacillus sp. GCM10027626 TaxID=3273411 RepID=UPI00364006F9
MHQNRKLQRPLYLMLLPSAVIVFIYSYIPMFGLIMAFQKFIPVRGFGGSQWVGLDNFSYMFSLPDTMNVFWNTLFIASMKIVAGLIAPIIVALLINEVKRRFVKRTVQTLIYLPHFLSWIIFGGILIDILSPSEGMVNELIQWFGLKSIFFLGDKDWFPYTLVLTHTWKEFGFGTIVYLAALSGINPALYEAAVIDGASRWRQTWHITLPGMRPIIVLMLTLSLGSVLSAGFEQVFTLYSPQVYETGDIIDTMVYRMGLVSMQYSNAAAIGLMNSVISFILICISYYLAYRIANYRIF